MTIVVTEKLPNCRLKLSDILVIKIILVLALVIFSEQSFLFYLVIVN